MPGMPPGYPPPGFPPQGFPPRPPMPGCVLSRSKYLGPQCICRPGYGPPQPLFPAGAPQPPQQPPQQPPFPQQPQQPQYPPQQPQYAPQPVQPQYPPQQPAQPQYPPQPVPPQFAQAQAPPASSVAPPAPVPTPPVAAAEPPKADDGEPRTILVHPADEDVSLVCIWEAHCSHLITPCRPGGTAAAEWQVPAPVARAISSLIVVSTFQIKSFTCKVSDVR